jgi:hypothetical protein
LDRHSNGHSWRLIRISLVSAALAILVSFLERGGVVPRLLSGPVALLPVVPLVVFFVRLTAWLDSMDELQRRIHLEAMVLQFAATGVLVMGYGMLAKSGVVPNYPATLLFPWLWIAMFLLWAGGIVWVRRRYR